jgi:hypothetical protein
MTGDVINGLFQILSDLQEIQDPEVEEYLEMDGHELPRMEGVLMVADQNALVLTMEDGSQVMLTAEPVEPATD